jgi:hypothetical protein
MKIFKSDSAKNKIFVFEFLGVIEITLAFFLKIFRKNVGYISIKKSKVLTRLASKISIIKLDFERISYIENAGLLLKSSSKTTQKITKAPEIISFINLTSKHFFKEVSLSEQLMVSLLSISELVRMRYDSIKKCAAINGYSEVYLVTRDKQFNLIKILYDEYIFILSWIDQIQKFKYKFRGIIDRLRSQKVPKEEIQRSTILRDARHDIIFIPHQGYTYGNLFSFEYLFETDPNSPLHKNNIGLLSYSEINPQGYGNYLQISTKINIRFLYKYFNAKRVFCAHLRGSRYKFLKQFVFTTCISALRSKEVFRSSFPYAKIAILAYQLNAPDHLLIALKLAGIESWTELGRPMFAVSNWSKINSHTVLSPSDKFSEFLERSEACVSEKIIPVGMWKTDLLVPKKSRNNYSHNKYLCVALPYHTTNGIDSFLNLFLSKKAFEHFVLDIIECAILYPEIDFIVRGKNSDWLNNDDYLILQNKLEVHKNITVSNNYETLNESYNLCSAADFIIGKYTSLIDESLAVSIPCIIHDYTHNADNILRAQIKYLPRRLWAESFKELCLQIDFCLDRSGDTFNEWWEQYRLSLYGRMNNGMVIDRTRQRIKQRLEK